MVLNKKGQMAALVFMLSIVLIILGLALAFPLNEITTSAMNETSEIGGMNCTGTTDDFVKAGCYTVDLTQVLFIGGLIALAGIIISAKIIFG